MIFFVMWLNILPAKSSVSAAFSPQTIMTGTSLDWKKHFRAKSGEYCKVHEEHHPSKNIDDE